jgi:hypothetical protein
VRVASELHIIEAMTTNMDIQLETIDPSDLVAVAGGNASVRAFANQVWRNGGAGDPYVSTLPLVSPRGHVHLVPTPALPSLGRSLGR